MLYILKYITPLIVLLLMALLKWVIGNQITKIEIYTGYIIVIVKKYLIEH